MILLILVQHIHFEYFGIRQNSRKSLAAAVSAAAATAAVSAAAAAAAAVTRWMMMVEKFSDFRDDEASRNLV